MRRPSRQALPNGAGEPAGFGLVLDHPEGADDEVGMFELGPASFPGLLELALPSGVSDGVGAAVVRGAYGRDLHVVLLVVGAGLYATSSSLIAVRSTVADIADAADAWRG